MVVSWRCCVLLVVFLNPFVNFAKEQKRCPPQNSILPCRCQIKGDEYQIWCSHSDLPRVLEGLKSIAKHIPEPIDELILENNYLPSLPGRIFSPLKIMRLMLRQNGLERVSSDWLVGLEKNLMEIYIVEPELRSLADDSLIHLEGLEAVTIQTNLMKRLPLFSGLQKLRYLQLESLSLLELSPRNFKNLPALEKLHIANSPRLARLEANFLQDLPRLELLNISYSGISWMHPRAITRLPALKELALIGNKITDVGMIGRAIRDLPQLEIMRLDHNYIDKISEASFVDLPSLKKLYLSNNHITEIHHGAFHHVPMLRSLDLNKNMVRRIHPESFLQHSGSGLEELWLVDNDISHIEEVRSLLDALPRLIFLDLSFNNLEAIPFGALRGHPTLEQLHLDYNKIHIIDREAFMAMPGLRELRLKNNSLSDMLDGPLWNLPALKGLDLSGNFFRHIDPRLLDNLPSLRRIDLSENELSMIDPATFITNTLLEHVNLSYNSLNSIHPITFRNLLKLYELDVRHNNLMEFVLGLPRGIEYVHLSYNQINSLPKSPSLELDLPSLRMLDLAANAIQRLSPNTFQSLSKLKKLYLGKNLLQQLDDSSLTGLSRLEVLDLQDNRIMLIHPGSLREMMELRELNLRNNRLDVLMPDMFRNTLRLKRLDVSSNKLAEVLPGTFDKLREMQIMDVSDNALVQLPRSLFGMKKLRILDLSKNRLKNIQPESLNSLTSLTEISFASNFVHELRKGVFSNLNHLRVLHLQDNEIEIIEANAIKSLPFLKSIKLNKNRLQQLPDFALNDLPSLQVAELQENQIRSIASKALNSIPHLLMLNLSYNQLENLDKAGLSNLRSLEMLDLSHNRFVRVASKSLEKMDSLVELKMDDNRICGIQGKPFDGMPRLKVLSLKNNKMSTLPEEGLQKVLGNIMLLDVDGNPLACTCTLLWLQIWLQEISSTGPRCMDGTPIREMRLSRQECTKEDREADPVAPGCEAEVLSIPGGGHNISQNSTGFKSNFTKQNLTEAAKKNQLAPSPEESDYFYDEYIDYPYNGTGLVPVNNSLAKAQGLDPSHYTPGDTPTIYAATKNKTKPDIPKEVNNSPSTSGFTFFGVPLPGLNNLWGGGNGRMNDKNGTPSQPPATQVAERKTAIVNKPQRGSSMRGIIKGLPNTPEIQKGGFIPLLPGSGGFKPIPNPNLQVPPNRSNNLPSPPTEPVNSQPITTTPINSVRKEGVAPPPTTSTTITSTTVLENYTPMEVQAQSIQVEGEGTVAKVQEITTHEPIASTIRPEIETVSNNQEKIDKNPFPLNVAENVTNAIPVTKLEPVTDKIKPNPLRNIAEPLPSQSVNRNEAIKEKIVATPLSALLIPGGQQMAFGQSPGRSTITKVQSPHVSGSAPLHADIEYPQISEPLPHNREGKNGLRNYPMTERIIEDSDTNWYFANYNKTNLEPFVGSGNSRLINGGNKMFSGRVILVIILLNSLLTEIL